MGNTYGDFTVFEYTVTVWFEMLCGGGRAEGRKSQERDALPRFVPAALCSPCR